MRYCAGLETGDTGAGFCVPDFHKTIVRPTDKLRAIRVEVDVRDGFGMAAVSSKEHTVAVNVEDFYLGIRGSRQEKMSCSRNESKSIDGFGSMFPSMYELPVCQLVSLPEPVLKQMGK